MRKYLLLAGAVAMTATLPAMAAIGDEDREDGRSEYIQDRDDNDDDDNRRGLRRGGDDDDDEGRRGWRGRDGDDDDDDDDDDGRRSRDRDGGDDDDNDGDRRWRGGDRDDARSWRRENRAEREYYQRIAREQRRYQREARRDRDRRYRSNDRDDGLNIGGLIGQILPAAVLGGYNVPAAYQSFYPDTRDYSYRYNDGNIMRIDRGSNIITSLIPLLGGGFGVGQLMPSGYDVYNVPVQYRDTYYDTPDANYRYGDNAIYQVDPQSGMIESVVALLAGGDMGVGSVLPSGYSAYNVPIDYRDRYYDTPESMYRYANGNIYQVDPQTQIIQAIIEALV